MAGTKYAKDKYTSENPFVDIIMSNVKALAYSCVVKDEYAADAAETVESLKESAIYISCVENHAELGLFDVIPHSFLVAVGMSNSDIINYEREYDQAYIPQQYHKDLVKLMIPYYIENYDEKNEYYRMITGLPPHGDPGVPIRDYDYLIPDYVTYNENFFHEETYQVNRSFEIEGVLDVVRAEYPEYKYLNYLTQGITLYDARKKMDFSILYRTDEMNYSLTKEFDRKYEECRKFVINTQYSVAYDIESPFYHSFMLAYTLLITVLDMLVEVQSHIVKKDVLDRRCIQYIFSMYEVPYYRTIPYKYQERLCKNVHNLVKYKSTDTEFFNLIKLFGFEDIEIFKWFILKNRKTNAWGEFIFDTTTQKVCKKNDFIYHDTVEIKMSDRQTRPSIPKDAGFVGKYFKGFGNATYTASGYVDKYIPFPFEYYLQKGNVMIVRLDNYILKESDYEIHNYNIIRFKNGIALGKSKLTFDFFYDINTVNDFLVDKKNRIETYVVSGAKTDDDHTFDLRDTDLNEFFISQKNQIQVVLNGKWLRQGTDYTIDYPNRLITISSSITLHKTDDIKFVFTHPMKFKTMFKRSDVTATATNASQKKVFVPEPFPKYCIKENEFFISINNVPIDCDKYTVTAVEAANQSYITLDNSVSLAVGDVVSFHFFYSNQALISDLTVMESTEIVTATSNYQYDFKVHFPVEHFVESGYKVYIKLLGWWLPAIFYTLVGKDTITFLDRSICDPNPGRSMEVHYFYLPYDGTEYPNIKVSTSYVESDKDFKKTFPITFPFDDFLAKGNTVIVDSEGVLLRKDVDYTMTTPVGNTATITIPNRDYRPMQGNRVNYTFFYNDDNAYRIEVDNHIIGKLTLTGQHIEIPFPFYPYLDTGHSFILQVGNRIVSSSNIKMVDKFHCQIMDATSADLNKEIHIIFIYNKCYINSNVGKMVVEWKQQFITDPYIVMDTPAEMYVENGWPYMVSYGNRLYLDETKYDVYNHTLYTNPVEDLANNVYGSYLNFIYIYTMKEGYMEDADTEVHSTNTDMHFSKAPINDLYQVQYIKDKANWRSYDSITTRDGWWDGLYYKNNAHEVIKNEISQKPFNYERTKYYGISNTVDLGDYAAQISYFYSIFYDDVFLENQVDILVPVLSPSHRFKLADLFIYMDVLTYIFNGYEDFIIDRPSKWLYVLGFNFKTDLEDLKKYLYFKNQHKSDFPIWDFIRPTSELKDIVEFFNMFKENYAVRTTILKGMVKANDYREYSIWKKIYDSLLIWKLNFEFFKLKNGTPAKTYTEFIKDRDTLLYNSIMTIKTITDQETLEDTIINICDAIIYELEAYIDTKEFKYLFSMYPGHDPNKAAKYMYMLVDFFKSYKITLLDRTETMDTGDPNDPDNYFHGIDQIERITESTLTADYMIPTETFETKETMEVHEWNSVPDTQSQLIEYKYPSHNANDTPSTPLNKYSNVRRLNLKNVKPKKDYDPVVTITKIVDAGRWMKEDVSIELYGKNTVRFEFYPCKININKRNHSYLLNSKFTYTKLDKTVYLNGATKINKELFAANKVNGTVKILPEPYDNIVLSAAVELTGRLFLYGYKMMTVYAPIFQKMVTIPTTDIKDLNDRIDIQRGSAFMTIEEMYKNSIKLEVVPPGIEYTNSGKMLYYNNFKELCADCVELIYFPFECRYFHYDNNDNIFDRAFYNCKKLPKIDNFEVSEYAACDCKTSFVQAFYNCHVLDHAVSLIGVTRDLDLTQAFYNCYKLTKPPIIRVMFNNLKMSQTFYKNESLTNIPDIYFPCTNPLYSSGRSKVDLSYTFEKCSNLKYNTSTSGRHFAFANTDINATHTFDKCTKLTKGVTCDLTVGCNGNFDRTYNECTSLVNSGEYNVKDNSTLTLDHTYDGCTNLTYAAAIIAEDTSKIYLNRTFEGCARLASIDNLIANYGGEYYLDHTFKDCTSLNTVIIDATYLKSWNGIFEGCTGLTSVTFKNVTPAMQFNMTHAKLDGASTLSYSIIFS